MRHNAQSLYAAFFHKEPLNMPCLICCSTSSSSQRHSCQFYVYTATLWTISNAYQSLFRISWSPAHSCTSRTTKACSFSLFIPCFARAAPSSCFMSCCSARKALPIASPSTMSSQSLLSRLRQNNAQFQVLAKTTRISCSVLAI